MSRTGRHNPGPALEGPQWRSGFPESREQRAGSAREQVGLGASGSWPCRGEGSPGGGRQGSSLGPVDLVRMVGVISRTHDLDEVWGLVLGLRVWSMQWTRCVRCGQVWGVGRWARSQDLSPQSCRGTWPGHASCTSSRPWSPADAAVWSYSAPFLLPLMLAPRLRSLRTWLMSLDTVTLMRNLYTELF